MKESLYNTIQNAIIEALTNTHTILVAKVVGVNETTIDCKPVINRVVDGVSKELTIFPKCHQSSCKGGGSYTAHPISEGDYLFTCSK